MNPENQSETSPPDPGSGGTADLFAGPPRSAERIDRVLDLVRREWLEHPDERFFQMVPNLAVRLGVSQYAFILEDDSLIDILEKRQSPGSH